MDDRKSIMISLLSIDTRLNLFANWASKPSVTESILISTDDDSLIYACGNASPLCNILFVSEVVNKLIFYVSLCYYKPNLCQVKMSTSNCAENSEIYY